MCEYNIKKLTSNIDSQRKKKKKTENLEKHIDDDDYHYYFAFELPVERTTYIHTHIYVDAVFNTNKIMEEESFFFYFLYI